MKTTLYVLGAILELVGIAFVAAPDLVPGARRFSRWAAPRWRRFENRVRRLVGLPPRAISVSVQGVTAAAVALGGTAIVTITHGATVEEKVEFLLRRDQERQQSEAEMGRRITAIERESPQRLAELRSDMEARVADEVEAAKVEYRPLRVLGALALTLGLALSTLGNLI